MDYYFRRAKQNLNFFSPYGMIFRFILIMSIIYMMFYYMQQKGDMKLPSWQNILLLSLCGFIVFEIIYLSIAYFTNNKIDLINDFFIKQNSVIGKSKKRSITINYDDITSIKIYSYKKTTICSILLSSELDDIYLNHFHYKDYESIIKYLKEKLPVSIFYYRDHKKFFSDNNIGI